VQSTAAGTAVILDRSTLVRHGVATLAREIGLTPRVLTGSTSDALGGLRPGELLIVGACPDAEPHSVVRRAKGSGEPARAVIVLADELDRASVLKVCTAGADAVLDRAAREVDLADAMSSIAAGHRHLGPTVLDVLMPPRSAGATTARDRPSDHLDVVLARSVRLSGRERAVLELLATGRSNREIAGALHIGVETVKTHLSNVYVKLGVRRRDQAIAAALRSGLL